MYIHVTLGSNIHATKHEGRKQRVIHKTSYTVRYKNRVRLPITIFSTAKYSIFSVKRGGAEAKFFKFHFQFIEVLF